MPNTLDNTGSIRRVTYFQASPNRTCDRCGTCIKHVFRVTYLDSTVQEYGSECINKILATEPSLRKLFNKNTKILQTRLDALRILNLPEDQMPRGSEYFGSGLYFIGDGNGKDITADTHWFFHPIYDSAKNSAGKHYVVNDPAQRLLENRADIEKGKVWLTKDIERIELFLAKVLRCHKVE